MNEGVERVEVVVEELQGSVVSADGHGVVLETEARVNGRLLETAIEVPQEDVPAIAVALLNTESGVAKLGAEMPPAVQCLAAGVVHTAQAGTIRLHLQFDSGQVLPIEMSNDAALALCRGIHQYLSGPPKA